MNNLRLEMIWTSPSLVSSRLEMLCTTYWNWALESMTWCNRLRFIYKLFIYVSWFPLNISFLLIGYLSIHAPHHLHCTWLGCIRSYTEDPSHRFLVEWWVVHNWFMDLGYPSETIVHYILIGGITCLSYWDGFPTLSALVQVMGTRLGLRWIIK